MRVITVFSKIVHTTGGRKWLFAVGAIILLGSPGHVTAGYGQVQERNVAADPVFEVVSVKPNGPVFVPGAPGERVYARIRPFRYSDRSLTVTQSVRAIIQEAYAVEDWAVVGPDWIDSETYEVAATMPPGTSRETARLMLRTMLAERFGLRFHLDKRDIPVYALVVGKHGSKLSEVTDTPDLSARMSVGTYAATSDLNGIAANCRRYADRPVVDMTGIKGVYHIELHWTPDTASRDDPEFWAELESRTGLKRESRRLPRDVIVIDHAERSPTPN